MSIETATLPADAVKGFRPPAPKPREKMMSSLEMLYVVSRNPLEVWNRIHFEAKSVARRNIMGEVVVLMDPAAIRHVMVDNAANYRKDDLQRRVLGADSGKGESLLTAEDELWRKTRRTVAPLFTPRRIAGFLPQMLAAAEKLAASWKRRPDTYPIDAAVEMTRVTFDVLSSTLFSNGVDNDGDRFGTAMTTFLQRTGKVDPLDVIGAPSWLPRIGRLRAKPTIDFFENSVAAIIATRRSLMAEGGKPPADLLTALLRAQDPESGTGLSDGEVAANLITFIGAGHETTANTLTWALYLLSQADDVRERLEAEVDAVDLGEIDAATLFETLPLTRAVIEEAMRLYPPAPNLSRQAIEPDVAAGVVIPGGATVYMPPYVLHRHTLLWDEPDYFQPDRFMPGRRESIDRFAYLPFGAGARICVAAQFAMMEAVIVLAALVKSARLEFAGDAPPRAVQRITLRPEKGMPMRLRKR